MDPLIDEQIVAKYVYFKNGYPSSGLTANIPSGDLLFKRFHSKFNKYDNLKDNLEFSYSNPIVSAEFGISYSDKLNVNYEYDIETKTLNCFGIYENDDYKTYVRKYYL
jgi:hypothetical protein